MEGSISKDNNQHIPTPPKYEKRLAEPLTASHGITTKSHILTPKGKPRHGNGAFLCYGEGIALVWFLPGSVKTAFVQLLFFRNFFRSSLDRAGIGDTVNVSLPDLLGTLLVTKRALCGHYNFTLIEVSEMVL